MLSRFKLTFFLFTAASMCGPVVLAQLTAYEGFQYPVLRQTPYLSPVTNKTPDGQPLKYFAEFDTHASRSPYDYTIQIVEGSIPTQGTPFPFEPKGNSLSWAREWLDAYGTIDRNFQFDTARTNPPLYVSFLIRAKPGAPVRQMAMAFSNGSSQRLQMGLDDSANTGRPRFFACVASPQPIRQYGDKTFEYDKTYFVIGKVTTSDSRKDTVQVNVYGSGDTVPKSDRGMRWQIEASDWTNYLVSDVAISLYGGEAGGLLFDELRIGPTWESVAVAPTKASVSASPGGTAQADGSSATTDGSEPSADELATGETSSPIVLMMIVVGIIAFLIGGFVFYRFVLKPGKKKQLAKPAAPPPKPSAPAPKPSAPAPKPAISPEKSEAASAEPKPAIPGAPKAPPPRKPIKPPPPK